MHQKQYIKFNVFILGQASGDGKEIVQNIPFHFSISTLVVSHYHHHQNYYYFNKFYRGLQKSAP